MASVDAVGTAPSPGGVASSRQGAAGRVATNPWVAFAVRRSGRLLASVLALLTASFLMVHLIPGDPVRAALGPTAPLDVVEQRRTALGLDEPLVTQYLDYVGGLATGDWGVSTASQVPVAEVIGQRLPATLQLALGAFALAVALAVPLGVGFAVLTRRGRGRRTELAFTTTSIVVGTIPDFVVGVGLVYVFGVSFGWLPVAGRSGASSLVMPVIALGIGPALVLARILRVEMLAALDAGYVRTARMKRLPPTVINLRHAMPNALTATLTLSGLLLGTMIAGTVLVENVFAWPGLGSTIVDSILNKDYPLVQGTVLVYGASVLALNTAVDVVLALIDPRSVIRST